MGPYVLKIGIPHVCDAEDEDMAVEVGGGADPGEELVLVFFVFLRYSCQVDDLRSLRSRHCDDLVVQASME